MMKTSLILLVATLALGQGLVQAAPSAEDIVKEHLKAMGGVEKARQVKTRQVVGTINMPVAGLNAGIVVKAKAPNKIRTEIDVPQMGKIVEGYDGKVAWTQNPFMGLVEKTGGQLRQAQEQADFYREVELLGRYSNWTLKGKESITGKTVDVVEGKSKDTGNTDVFYFEEKTHLLTQLKTEAETELGKMVVIMKMSDYREVDGMKLPHLLDVEAGPSGYKMTITEIKHGVELADSLFAKPAK